MLQKYGHWCFLVPEKVLEEDWCNVYIGTFQSKQEARRTGLALNKKGIISHFELTKGDQIHVAEKREVKHDEQTERATPIPPKRIAEKGVEQKGEPLKEETQKPPSGVAEPLREGAGKGKEKIEPAQTMPGEEQSLLYTGSGDDFSIDFSMGVFLLHDKDFTITKKGTATDEVWEISDKEAFHIGIIPSYRFNKTLALYCGLEGILGDDINAWF